MTTSHGDDSLNNANTVDYEIGDIQYHVERIFDDETPRDRILIAELQKSAD